MLIIISEYFVINIIFSKGSKKGEFVREEKRWQEIIQVSKSLSK